MCSCTGVGILTPTVSKIRSLKKLIKGKAMALVKKLKKITMDRNAFIVRITAPTPANNDMKIMQKIGSM